MDISGDVPPSPRCALCSQCCKSLPGQFLPSDLGPDVEARKAKAREFLETGDYSIDWYEGDPREYYTEDVRSAVYHIRPATRSARGRLLDPSWGGECVFLEADGCSLPRDDRPSVCKSLIPAEDGPCTNGISKQQLAIAWLDDHDWLKQLAEPIQPERKITGNRKQRRAAERRAK